MTKYQMAFQKVESSNEIIDDNSDLDEPPTGSSTYERDDGNRLDSLQNRYPQTPEHSHEEITESTWFNTALKTVLFAIILTLGWSVASLRHEVDRLSAYQTEHLQIVSTLISEIEQMKIVEWRMVPA